MVSWSVIPCDGEAPPARDGHSAVVLDDQMLMFGGFEEVSQRYIVFNVIFKYWAFNFINRKIKLKASAHVTHYIVFRSIFNFVFL